MCPKDLASKVIVLLRKSFMFIIDFKTNKFYSYMLRGSSRCVRGSDIARNIISGISRKQFLRGSIRGSCGCDRGSFAEALAELEVCDKPF